MTDFTELRRDSLARHLRKHLAGEVRFDTASRRLYSTDASIYRIEPLGVVLPKSVEDVVATVQIAGEMHVPITPRGGGTSLSGQSIGPGIVLDCSKYLNAVLDIDPVRRVARVQPGVVLDAFNRALAPHNLLFGPEVSTSSRANLGGMIGNNSAGSRSIVYGKTIDHVRRTDVVLGDGSLASFGTVTPDEWDRRAEKRTLEGGIYRQVREVVRRHRDEIHRRFPRILRRVSGYNLDVLADNLGTDAVGIHQLLVGSEGTLAVMTEAEVGLLPKPKTPRPAGAAVLVTGGVHGRGGGLPGIAPFGGRINGPLSAGTDCRQLGPARDDEGHPRPAAGGAHGRVQRRR